jgi:hypothetical protein
MTSSHGRKLQDEKSLNERCIYLRSHKANHSIEDQELSELKPSISSYYTSQRTLENSIIVRQAKLDEKLTAMLSIRATLRSRTVP